MVEFESTNQRKAVFIPFAKENESHIRAFLLAFPLSNEWFFLLADKQTLLSLLSDPAIDSETKEFFTIVYLNFDSHLFGETDEVLADWLALNGDNNGLSSSEDEIQSRCTYWLIFVGTCTRPQVFQPEDDHLESRWPCPPGSAPSGIFSVEEGSDCGSTNGVPFPSGNGSGGNGWTGTAPGGSGNNGSTGGGGNNGCTGCGNDPWGDPIVSVQMQRCDLLANIIAGQVPGNLNDFSQAEIDLCTGLNTIVTTLTVDGTDLSFLVGRPDILASLQAFIESGVATAADMAAMNRFLNLWKAGKISMAWREFLALHRLVFGKLVPELGLTEEEGLWLLENAEIAHDIDVFLDAENRSENARKVVNILIDIAAGTETPLTTQQFKELLDAFDLYFDDPENNAEQLVDALIAQIQFLFEENFLYPEYYYPVKDTVFRDATFSSNQKTNCVYNKLRNQNSNLFKSTIRNFIGSKMYNLRLVVVDLPIGDATTTPPDPNQNNLITIKIDPDHIITSYPIELAGTILHEGIHAEMKRYVLAKGGVLRDYPELWHYYTYYKNGGATWPLSDAEHALMAYKYVDDIAASLKIFDNNQFSLDHYKYIALQGLARHTISIDQATRNHYLQLHNVMIANRSKNCID